MAIGLRPAFLCLTLCAAPAFGQSGLKLPERGELGIDPTELGGSPWGAAGASFAPNPAYFDPESFRRSG